MKSFLPSVLLLSVACPWLAAGCSSKVQPHNIPGVAPSGVPSVTTPSTTPTGSEPVPPSPTEPPSTVPPSPTEPGSTVPTSGTSDGPTDSSSPGTTTTASDDSESPTVDSSNTSDSPTAPAGDVSFSVPSCTFEGSLTVTMAAATAGAEVRYTTDGTLPTATSTLYDGTALAVTETTQLRAQQFVAGAASGAGNTAIYIRRTFDVSSDISLIIMEAYGGGELPTAAGPEKVIYRDLGFMLFEPINGTAAISAPPTWASRAGYHVRGQSSASFPKTPYRVELWDENNDDRNEPMIGMPADSDWAMIGEYSDKTLVRNAFSFSLAVEMGLNAPEMRFAEVYLNQDVGPLEAEDYQGVYAVTETIKNNSDRLNLKQLKPDDTDAAKLSGGYIFKFDMAAVREDEGEIQIPCTGDTETCFEDLELTDPVEPNAEQLAWISDYVSQAHTALVSEPVGDYAAYLDVKSFVDMLVLNELTKGGDKYVRSVYLHKDRDKLITAGPAWDYNFTLGNLVNDVEGWQVDSGRDTGTNWFRLLFMQPEIKAAMAARWAELRPNILSDAAIEARIDAVAAPLVNAGPRDLERWPVTAGGVFGGGAGGPGGAGGAGGADTEEAPVTETPLTWTGHFDEMKVWIRERTAWLDAEYATF